MKNLRINDLLTLSMLNNVNSTKSIFNTYNKINKLTEIEAPRKDYNELINKMEKSYFDKSLKSKKFFLYNISQKINRYTNKPIIDFTNNAKQFTTFKQDFHYENGKDNGITTKWTKELIQGDYLIEKDNVYSNKKIRKVKYLEEINQDKESAFLTFTLPTEYHYYKIKNGTAKKDIKYGNFDILELNQNRNKEIIFEDLIKKGLNKITDISTSLTNKTRNKLKTYIKSYSRKITNEILKQETSLNKKEKKKLRQIILNDLMEKNSYKSDFIKIIEPHKNLTPHLHILIFFKEEHRFIIEEAFNEIIEEYKLNEDFCKLEKINKNRGSATTYITKYLTKNFNENTITENITEKYFFNFFRRYFNETNFFLTSNFQYTTQNKINIIYSFFQKHNKELLNRFKNSGKSLYRIFELMEKRGDFIFEEATEELKIIDYKKIEEAFINICEELKINLIDLTEEEQKELIKSLYESGIFNNTRDLTEEIFDNSNKFFTIRNDLLKKRKNKLILKLKNSFNDFTKTYNHKKIKERKYKGKIIYRDDMYIDNVKPLNYFALLPINIVIEEEKHINNPYYNKNRKRER
jgi:hypothetical protein